MSRIAASGRRPRRSARTPGSTGAIVAVALWLALAAVPAGSQTADEAGPEEGASAPAPALRLVEQTAWVDADGIFEIAVEADEPLAVAGVTTVSLRNGTASRNEFTVGLGEAGPGPVRNEVEIPTVLGLEGDRRVRLTLDTGPAGPLPIDEPGVYPLVLSTESAVGETVSLFTHLVRLPVDDARPDLRVAVIVPVGTAPLLGPDGVVQADPAQAELLDRAVGPLSDQPDVPLTVAPVPETLESLSESPPAAPLVEELAGALDGRQVLGSPYVQVDTAEWLNAQLTEPLDRQLVAGETTLAATIGVTPERSTRYEFLPPDEATVEELQQQGASRLIVPAATIPEAGRPAPGTTWPGPVLLTTPTTQIATAVLDPALQAHAGRTGDPVLDAHRTLADLATVATTRSDVPSGSVFTVPDLADASPEFLATLLAHIDGGPLSAVTVDDWFTEVSPTPAEDPGAPEATLNRSVAPRVLFGLGRYPSDLGITELTLTGLTNLTDGEDPTLPSLRRQTLTSGSALLTGEERAAYLSAVGGTIRERTGLITSPSGQTVTLTSRRARVPVAVSNAMGVPARVRITVTSDRLEFPEGSQIEVVLEDGATTVQVPVEARTTGSFRMQVDVSSPDGVLAITSVPVSIRSTAVSGVGIALSIGAGLVLATWWVRNWHSSRRDHRLISREDGPA